MLFGKRLKKRFIGLAGLLVLGVTVHFLDEQRPQSFDLFSELPESPSEPDYYTVNSSYREYDASGRLSHTLHSQRLLHYPEQQQATLEAPELTAYRPEGIPDWHARSDQGTVESDGSHFQLNQNVIVWQLSDQAPYTQENPPVRLQLATDQLQVDMKREQATSPTKVYILTADSETRAYGLFADLKHNSIQLLRQVNSRYNTRSGHNLPSAADVNEAFE